MLPFTLLISLSLACFAASAPVPNPKVARRDLTLSHTSASGELASAKVDSWLRASIAKSFLDDSDPTVHHATTGWKRSHLLRRAIPGLSRRSSPPPSASHGIANSTINLTVISRRNLTNARRETTAARRETFAAKRAEDAEHHNVYIDASGASGTGGGIHGSTINVNVITNSKRAPLPSPSPEPGTTVGEHSVLLDLSNDAEGNGGIEDSTVHVNILPARGDKAIGDHSILIDSSSQSNDDETTAGDHSAVVASSISSSTINLTVVAPKSLPVTDSPSAESSPAKLAKRDEEYPEWVDQVKMMAVVAEDVEVVVPPPSEVRYTEAEWEQEQARRATHASRRTVVSL